MFSGSLFVVLLVVFVSRSQGQSSTAVSSITATLSVPPTNMSIIGTSEKPTSSSERTLGQNNTTVSPNATSSVLSQSSTVTIMNSPPITIVPTTPTTTPLMGQSSTTVNSSAAVPPVPPQSSITATLSVHPTTMSIIGTSEKPTSSSERTQGQSSTAVTPSVTANATSSVQSSTVTVVNGHSSITPTTKPIMAKTCAMLGVTINLAWNEDYGNKSSETYKNLSKEFSSALEKLLEKHQDVKVSNVNFKNKTDKVFAEAKLCLVFTEGEDSIKDVFFDKLKTGKLSENLPVVKDSAEFKALEVEYKNYEAKEGECDKCDGGAGPFDIEGECVPDSKEFSCNGLEEKKTKKTEDCPTYCPSTALTVTVSSLILAIGILLSSSFQ